MDKGEFVLIFKSRDYTSFKVSSFISCYYCDKFGYIVRYCKKKVVDFKKNKKKVVGEEVKVAEVEDDDEVFVVIVECFFEEEVFMITVGSLSLFFDWYIDLRVI